MNTKVLENSESTLTIGFNDKVNLIFKYRRFSELIHLVGELTQESDMRYITENIKLEYSVKVEHFLTTDHPEIIKFLIELCGLGGIKPRWFFRNLSQSQFERLIKSRLGLAAILSGVFTKAKPYMTQSQKSLVEETLMNHPRDQKLYQSASDYEN